MFSLYTYRVKCPADWRPCFSPIWTIFELENCPDHWWPCFQRTRTTFELNQHIIKTNILTNFQLHRDIIGTNLLSKFHEDRTKMWPLEKSAPPTGGHVFQQTRTPFELNHHIIKTNILTKFELDRDIIGTKLLTKFHEDRKRNSFYYINIMKTARPPGNHVFQRTGTIFELNSHIKETNFLTTFHEN
ncbi:hypothetical protein DPMN_012128 [Dreissena polymorpha]|uniref:Uncharacterized protein n=1 Tax=Dreissena polymorpha TaxID=45954 RepID=A0A9D4S2I6_DREPO|nr:hypothetical protein DPMN_012128 [Dreissena polymorpha]